jgi:hypothetical protein
MKKLLRTRRREIVCPACLGEGVSVRIIELLEREDGKVEASPGTDFVDAMDLARELAGERGGEVVLVFNGWEQSIRPGPPFGIAWIEG